MKLQKRLDPQLEINVKVMHVAEQSKPEEHFFYFAYQITIRNNGSVPAPADQPSLDHHRWSRPS